jgi:hypothetical protein
MTTRIAGKLIIATIVVIGVAPREAASQPVDDLAPPSDESWTAEPTADAVAGAPVPGHESGRIDPPSGDSAERRIARLVLFVPRLALNIAFAPVRLGMWTVQHYRLHKLFFSENGTYGAYPTLFFDTDNQVTVGARFVHHDLFGAHERLSVSAGTNAGGLSRRFLRCTLRSGDRFGERLDLSVAGEYARVPDDPFYGVGNGDDDSDGVFADNDFGIKTRYAERLVRARAAADLRLAGRLYLRGAGSIADIDLGRSEKGPPIDLVYPTSVVGIGGFRHVYAEGELRWDTRRRGSWWEPLSVRSTGWLLAGFGGRVFGIENSGDYWRYGVDLQRFVRIGKGPRVLSGRLYGEAVTGSHDEVPFTELPRLGGKTLLRGYPRDRFRDRVSAMGSVEYSWSLSQIVSASTFVDVGRVFRSVDDLELDALRLGYGFGLELHTDHAFIGRASVASSIDGGVFFNLAFDPVFDLEPRVERR